MKTKKLVKKLILNKKTVADLSHDTMGKVYGGDDSKPVTQCVNCPTHTLLPPKSCPADESVCLCPLTDLC